MKTSGRRDIFSFNDIHSHVPGEGRVLSVDFSIEGYHIPPDQYFTLGIHPWHADMPVDWVAFERLLHNPYVVGIGEAGLDALKGPDISTQESIFVRQLKLAEKYGLPLVIHSVRTNHRILALKKKYNPSVPWIIHGFRGGQKEAQQLIDAGIHLSLGKVRRAGVERLSREFLHNESDEEATQ